MSTTPCQITSAASRVQGDEKSENDVSKFLTCQFTALKVEVMRKIIVS